MENRVTVLHHEPAAAREALDGACQLLFGEGTEASAEFIAYMRLPGLKAAFHRLARQCHPDTAALNGGDVAQMQERFLAARRAYELLVPYVTGEKAFPRADAAPSFPRFSRPPSWAPSRGAGKQAARTYYRGGLPSRPLRLGEYLYYRGCVCREDWLGAIAWQRLHRPRIGDLAREQGLLSPANLFAINRQRLPGELIGAAAVRLGFLCPAQVSRLLGLQRRHGAPFGQYFTERALLSPARLDALLRENLRHNLQFRPASAAAAARP